MSKVRSLGRLWIVAVATVFACMLALSAAPAHAAEDTGTGSTDSGINVTNPDNPDGSETQPDDSTATDPDDGDDQDTQEPGQTVPGDDDDSGDATDPDDADKPDGDDDASTDKPAGDKPDDQDKTDQDTPDDPADKPDDPEPSYEDTHTNMYRLYNPNSGEHFYTMSLHEATSVAEAGWQWEGIGWVAPLTGTPVYRLYNPNAGDHHYTTSDVERAHLISVGWNDEGIGWYSDSEDHTAVLRQYNPNATAGAHNFTTSWVENDHLVGVGWNHEGLAWYATNGPNLAVQARWLITNAWGSLERYWIGTDGNIVKERLINPDEGTGYYAYAKGDGAIVRGKHYTSNDYVYVADQEGRLFSKPDGQDGWFVTDSIDGGMQRYYYVADHHAMRAGFFTIDGTNYYGLASEGYVLRGKFNWNGIVLLGSFEDGTLATGTGWLVTDIYDGGTQRYWLVATWENSPYSGAQTGMIYVDGGMYHGDSHQGYIERNKYVYDSRWYKANNDGWLTESESPEEGDMMLRAQGMRSPTDFLILVDTGKCRVGIFRGGNDNWNLDRFEPCVCGAPWSPTITGTYSTGYHLPVLPDWSNALYCTNITGGYFFHSVLGSTDELGQHLSHGCIRLDWPFAQYMQTVPYGSTVHLY
ncbi:MAG: L,D-transpeptidase family protein [Coriobacteriales bacterium]